MAGRGWACLTSDRHRLQSHSSLSVPVFIETASDIGHEQRQIMYCSTVNFLGLCIVEKEHTDMLTNVGRDIQDVIGGLLGGLQAVWNIFGAHRGRSDGCALGPSGVLHRGVPL